MISAKIITHQIYSNLQHVLPLWQPIGYSTYQITNSVALKYRVKATHTGVLDPLAEGVIIVLKDEERLNKQQFTSWRKEYEFDMLFGLSTDSFDGLGFVEHVHKDLSLDVKKLKKVLQSLIGAYAQKVPLYSAQKVAGRKLFMYPKLGMTPPEIPVKTGLIYKIELKDLNQVSLHKKINEIIEKIKMVKKGEFRQEKVVDGWNKFMSQNKDEKLFHAKILVEMSRGLYVRSLCRDIANKLDTHAFVTRLVRTKNGPYDQKNSQSLEKVFGDNFNHDLLVSKYSSMVNFDIK